MKRTVLFVFLSGCIFSMFIIACGGDGGNGEEGFRSSLLFFNAHDGSGRDLFSVDDAGNVVNQALLGVSSRFSIFLPIVVLL